jgi:hypothetical protein
MDDKAGILWLQALSPDRKGDQPFHGLNAK